jgi:hypothetical protein
LETISYNGKLVEAREIEVLTTSEYWNSYTLANGKILRTKTVLVSVLEAVSEKDPEGNPLFVVKGNNIIKVLNNKE